MREERARWFGALKGVVGAGAADTPAEVLPRTLGVLAASPACHVLVNVEDLWGEMESQNAPGTVAETNWTLRARYSLEEWSAVPGLEETLSAVERLRRGHPSDESTTAQGARSRRRPARGRQWPE